jgi:hypothetical protein
MPFCANHTVTRTYDTIQSQKQEKMVFMHTSSLRTGILVNTKTGSPNNHITMYRSNGNASLPPL